MAKRKENIDLKAKNIMFMFQNEDHKALLFYPHNMTVDVIALKAKGDEVKNIAFAHLPKDIKKMIKPN